MSKSTCVTDGCDEPVRARGMCKRCYRKDHYRRNREKALADAKAAYDSQKARERYLRLRDDPEFQRKRRETYARWKQANPDGPQRATKAWRRANAERVRENMRLWRDANRESLRLKKRAANRLRRGRIAETVVGPVDYAAILDEHGFVCHICGGVIIGLADLHMDHVIPLALGGPHSAENIRPAHAFCNISKGCKLIA